MTSPIASQIADTDTPAIAEAYRWLDAATLPANKPFLNVSQAAPALAPPKPLRQFMADQIMTETAAHLYGPDLGNPPLRAALAANIAAHYGGLVTADQVAITAGCNQAYTAAIASLAQAGDEMILPTPWYFNHQMWCHMNGIKAVPLPCGADLIPDPDHAAALITQRTRALVLVTPNNPTGKEYPAGLIRAFYDLAKSHGLALVIDETYRDFHSGNGAPHDLFTDPNWSDTLIHLYSFSKAYRLTGHRVGAMATSATRLAEVEKFIDSTTICPGQLGQRAALWGLKNLGQWVAGERAEILARRDAITAMFERLEGWTLRGCGAYFAFVDYPFDANGETVAKTLLTQQGVLALPGAFFAPPDDANTARSLRLAFANFDQEEIDALHDRLRDLSLAP